jgi:hypothetical protein
MFVRALDQLSYGSDCSIGSAPQLSVQQIPTRRTDILYPILTKVSLDGGKQTSADIICIDSLLACMADAVLEDATRTMGVLGGALVLPSWAVIRAASWQEQLGWVIGLIPVVLSVCIVHRRT